MKNFLLALLIILMTGLPVLASEMRQEIAQLLSFVERTACKFERNGGFYSGKNAALHMRKKYHYYRSEIDSAEKFIELSATKSTVSGKYYWVHCEGKAKIPSGEWLRRVLESFRVKI